MTRYKKQASLRYQAFLGDNQVQQSKGEARQTRIQAARHRLTKLQHSEQIKAAYQHLLYKQTSQFYVTTDGISCS